MVKAQGAGRFGCLANVRCTDANGKVQTSCSVAVECSVKFNLPVLLFVFGLAGRLFVSIRIANSGMEKHYLYLPG